ncbi:MAG: hypothetical protein IPM52_09590 [Bacteroidetes bacterium]|nr:hypothetical protein [Bacteroidota bacterium]
MHINIPGTALVVNGLALLLIALYFDRRKQEPLAESVWWLMIAAAWWSVFYGMELSAESERYLHLLFVMEFPAVMTVPVFWLLFVVRLTGYRFLKPYRLGWLFVVPAFNWLMLISNPLHHLFYTGARIVETNGYSYTQFDPGPVFLFVHIVYSHLLVAAGLMLLVRALALSTGINRNKAVVFLFAATLPYILSLFWILNIRPYGFLDLTPFGFTVIGLTMFAFYKNLSDFELRPLVLNSLFDNLPDPLVVVDVARKHVTYTNASGQQLLKALEETNENKSHFEQLKQLTDETQLEYQQRYY